MPKQPDALFQLIKSMTKAEKRYFKVTNSKSNGEVKDYIRLFDAIEAQKKYDEKAVSQRFKGEPYFNQLAAVKLYLYRQILASLSGFHQQSSVTVQLNRYATEIEVLFNKGLYKSCQSSIRKAQALAIKYELWLDILKFNAWEFKLINFLYRPDQQEAAHQGFTKTKEEFLSRYHEASKMQKLSSNVLHFFRKKGYAKTAQERHDIEVILSNPLLHEMAHSFEAEHSRIAIIANCSMILGRHEERFEASKRIVELLQEHPLQIEANLTVYFHNLRELADQAITLKKFAYAEELILLMTEFYQQHQNQLGIKSKILFLDLNISLLVHTGSFKEALEYIPEIDLLTNNLAAQPQSVEMLYLNNLYFHIYFRNKDYRKTQYYIQQIMSNTPHIRWDMHCLVRIAYLIIQYEQREYEHLGYMLRSTYRYLLNKQMLEKPEIIILNFIRNAAHLTNEKQVLRALSELKEQFSPYRNEAFIQSFPLIEWIDSKLQNRELADIIKENYLSVMAGT